ncbi:MAG: HNH endonuclease, partial [Ignavibacteria bacterium]
PITICNVWRAVVLAYLGKAEIISRLDGKRIKSVYRSFECPSIVRLSVFVRVPFKKIILSRKNILRRDNHKCQYCGSTVNLTIDHIIPKSKGGDETWENLVTACIDVIIKKETGHRRSPEWFYVRNPKNHRI